MVAGKPHRLKRKSLVGQCVLVLLGAQVLFFASFVGVNLPTGTGHNLLNYLNQRVRIFVNNLPDKWRDKVIDAVPAVSVPVKAPIRYDLYTPQVPAAIFLGYTLGYPVAPVAAAFFVLIGAGRFIIQYISVCLRGWAGVLYSAWFRVSHRDGGSYLCGKHHHERLRIEPDAAAWSYGRHSDRSPDWTGLHTWLFGHFCFYRNAAPGVASMDLEQTRNMSWYPLPYDVIFALALIGLGFPLRSLVGVLTAPDSALRSLVERAQKQRVEEIRKN